MSRPAPATARHPPTALVASALLVLAGAGILAPAAGSRTGETPRPGDGAGEARAARFELLLDDASIDRRAGVRRVLGRPVKSDGPVFKGERPWERSAIHPAMGLFFDDEEQKFRMWYKAVSPKRPERPRDRAAESSEQYPEERTFICYAESRDGVAWERPALNRVPFDGSRANNIITEVPVGDTVFFNVVKDPSDPDPARRYKSLGYDAKAGAPRAAGVPGPGLYVNFSADGLSWPKPPVQVMTSTDLTDSNCILPRRDPLSGCWVGFFRPRTSPKRRFIGYSESRDFERWTYPRMLLTPDAGDDEWTEFYGLAATVVGSWRVGLLWVFHNNPAYSPVTSELVYSRDGQQYHRALPGREFLPLGADDRFDSRCIYPLAWAERGAEHLIFYSATNTEHGSDRGIKMQREARTAGGAPSTWGVGLARVPWGHLAGLRADHDGMVETQWLANYGPGGVTVAAAIDPGGTLQGELLDQYGKVIPGWGRESSRIRTGAKGKLLLSWSRDDLDGRFGQVSDQGGKVGHVVKLRFHLRRATLFGFEIGGPTSSGEAR